MSATLTFNPAANLPMAINLPLVSSRQITRTLKIATELITVGSIFSAAFIWVFAI